MKLFTRRLPAGMACVEVDAMSSRHAHLVAMLAATAVNGVVRALNNNNANNNTRIHGWAGV